MLEINVDPAELREQIVERAAQKIADQFADERMPNLSKRVEALLKSTIEKHCDDVVGPMIAAGVGDRLIQRTNEYGEKAGEAKTLTEYLVESANAYLSEPVDYEGKPKTNRGFGNSTTQTRLVYMIDKHLQYRIQNAMEQAVADINKQIAPAIADTIKIQVEQIAQSIVKKRR